MRIKIGPGYREYTDNREVIEVKGGTVRDCLSGLIALFPIFESLLYGSEHPLSALIIYRDDLIVPDQLDRPVRDGDEFTLLPMVYGG